MKKSILKIFFVFFLFLIFIFVGTMSSIYAGVSSRCKKAKNLYGKDCVGSMLEAVNSHETSFREKNEAVWVLGQLADKRALPTLKKLYIGTSEGKESLDREISQYELKKAIKWCENGNLTSFMYKNIK